MKVLLIKDVYNLGRAGEVKKVADGYARNFLIPQKMAVISTAGALKQIEKIEAAAAKKRELLNEEMSGIAEKIAGLQLEFKAKIGETGKLYGSVTQQMIIDAVNDQIHANLDRHQVESQPLRQEGEHDVRIRLTYDLVPEIKVIVVSEEEEEQEAQEEQEKKEEAVQEESISPEDEAETAGEETTAEGTLTSEVVEEE